jgi:hypothetical protein
MKKYRRKLMKAIEDRDNFDGSSCPICYLGFRGCPHSLKEVQAVLEARVIVVTLNEFCQQCKIVNKDKTALINK